MFHLYYGELLGLGVCTSGSIRFGIQPAEWWHDHGAMGHGAGCRFDSAVHLAGRDVVSGRD